MNDIPTNCLTLAGIIILAVIAVTVAYTQTDHLLLETIITVIAGLTGYKIGETKEARKSA